MNDLLHRARFRLDHRWAPPRMSDYLDAELRTRGRVRMERHLGECGECRRLLAGIRATVGVLQRLRAPGGEVEPTQMATSVRLRLRDGQDQR